MPRIRAKYKKGNPYYYVVTSIRCGPNNSPREKILEYIGPEEKLMSLALEGYNARNRASPEPESDELYANLSFKSYVYGSTMAMLNMARKIGLEEIMDACFLPKTIKGMKRSQVLLLEMIHHADDPGSMLHFETWIRGIALPYYMGFDMDILKAQDVWEAMDGITDEQIEKAHLMTVQRLAELFPVEFRTLHLDYTNFFTWISSRNGRCTICFRGHNKQKRDDLRQFSLAVITSFDLQIPLFWNLYEGNKNDKSEFADFVVEVESFCRKMGLDPKEITLTFDGGSNSEEKFSNIPFHIICAHSLTGMKELYDIDLDQYQEVTLGSSEKKRLAYRVDDIEFSGKHGVGILTFSEDLKGGQVAEMKKDIDRAKEKFENVLTRLNNPRSSLQRAVRNAKNANERDRKDALEYNEAIRKEYEEKVAANVPHARMKKEKELPNFDAIQIMRDTIATECFGSSRSYLDNFMTVDVHLEDGIFSATLSVDESKKNAYIRKYYGKKLTVTTHEDWTTEQILTEYMEQECVENLFRVSKDPDHFSVRPQHHWTDDKIRMHVFICMTTLIIAEALRMGLEASGFTLTKEKLMEELGKIRDGWVFLGEKKVKRAMEKLDAEQQKLWDAVLATTSHQPG